MNHYRGFDIPTLTEYKESLQNENKPSSPQFVICNTEGVRIGIGISMETLMNLDEKKANYIILEKSAHAVDLFKLQYQPGRK